MADAGPIVEKAVAFGPRRSLVGVWTAPANGTGGDFRPAVVMLNSGVIHHVGSWRLHVRLARALAANGFPSLRFDLAGLGDSERRAEAATIEENAAKDVRDALDFVRNDRGVEGSVLLGLCSGARDSLEAGECNPDVVGVVVIDLVADLRTPRYYLVRYRRRLGSGTAWRNFLAGRNPVVSRLRDALRGGSESGEDQSTEAGIGLRWAMSRPHLVRVVSSLLERDVKQLYLFSGGLFENYNHGAQFGEALAPLAAHPNVTYDYLPEADHTFSRVAEQQALIAGITGWMRIAYARKTSQAPTRVR